ncbi:MAG TPA: carboxypeptidase regulatory-like domain-containing protein [Chthoniobacteraceae bacterium]|jgi:plastocyanin
MKGILVLVLPALMIFHEHACAQAVVEGKVELRKNPKITVLNQRYEANLDASVVAPDPPTAAIYIEGNFPAPKAPPHAELAQKNLAFVTPLLPVETGTIVSFPNLDDTYHNIFSYSKAKRFDLGRYRGDERPIPSQVFDTPGVVALHCDIHEHMHGVILVLSTPHFTKSDQEGRYRLGGLPPGHYTLKAWVDSKTTYEKPVDLKSGSALHVDFP